jgi:hypothetical protein
VQGPALVPGGGVQGALAVALGAEGGGGLLLVLGGDEGQAVAAAVVDHAAVLVGGTGEVFVGKRGRLVGWRVDIGGGIGREGAGFSGRGGCGFTSTTHARQGQQRDDGDSHGSTTRRSGNLRIDCHALGPRPMAATRDPGGDSPSPAGTIAAKVRKDPDELARA